MDRTATEVSGRLLNCAPGPLRTGGDAACPVRKVLGNAASRALRRFLLAGAAVLLLSAGLAPDSALATAQAREQAGAAQQAPGHRVPDTIGQRVQACVVCHGKEGRATAEGYLPRIAGKPAVYLYNQLLNFRDGRRQNAAMTKLLAHLSDNYLREVAEYFASVDLPYPPPQIPAAPAPALARGEALVLHGDPGRQLPSCRECHGTALMGVQPAVPGLLGLPRDSLVAQLGAWKLGGRQAQSPDCMARIAKGLSPEDVFAITTWLASQPVPPDHAPAPAASGTPELECGGVPR
jgi:cytochrome c553